MNRTQFTFYESFARAISRIKKKADRADAYDAIVAYALYGEAPDLDKLPDSAAIAFDLIKPTLDASKRKAESGRRGGSQKQSESKTEANPKQSAREKENEKEKENEIENECYPPTPLRGGEKAKGPEFAFVLEYAKLQRAEELAKPFFDYYAAANWRDSENKPVYNWQQKFIAWKQRDEEKKRAQLARGLKLTEDTKPVDRSSELARMDRYLAKMREET